MFLWDLTRVWATWAQPIWIFLPAHLVLANTPLVPVLFVLWAFRPSLAHSLFYFFIFSPVLLLVHVDVSNFQLDTIGLGVETSRVSHQALGSNLGLGIFLKIHQFYLHISVFSLFYFFFVTSWFNLTIFVSPI